MFEKRNDLLCRSAFPRRAGISVTAASAILSQPGCVLFPGQHSDSTSGTAVRAPPPAERFGARALRRTVSVYGPGQCSRNSSEVSLALPCAADIVHIR